ncbi:MAG: hypothetical protein ACO1OB_29350 [Archangium sp.]
MWIDELTAWGWLPVALPALVLAANRAARLLLKDGSRVDRLAATAVFAMGFVHASVGVLGTFSILSTASLLAVLLITAVCLAWLSRELPSDQLFVTAWRRGPEAVVLGVCVLLAVALTARLLPIWQWDAYGYHLPFVNFVLQSHGFSGVPQDLRYITTYPHNVELGMIWLRAMLPDDRLVDLAQVPYGLAGAVLTSAVARRLGAERGLAMLAGAAWLAVPAVFLQMPTNYVDVGMAAALLGAVYFLLVADVSWKHLVIGGLALGLFLGSKPSAPVAVVFVGLVTVIRAVRACEYRGLVLCLAVCALFGAGMYLEMFVRHGNPVWPVQVKLGPITLPGDMAVEELLAAGADLPRATGGLFERLSVSWLAIGANPVFDMKVGGLGLILLLSLPLALYALIHRKNLWLAAALVATLLVADPAIPRYVLAFPALLLALALSEVTARWSRGVTVAVLLVSAGQVLRAWPGLTGDGPSWSAYLDMNDEERRMAAGPQGPPTDYLVAWAEVARDETVAFDMEFEFPGLLWSPDLSHRVEALPKQASVEELSDFLEARRVKLVAVGEKNAALLRQTPQTWERLFDCRTTTCAVFVRRDSVAISE